MARQAIRRPLVWLLTTTLLAALFVAPAVPAAYAQTAAPPPGCPEPLPVDQIRPGLRGTGLTVVAGTAITTFDVTVVDVLRDGIAPGYPLIVVEADSPDIRRVGGIWGGMSGSPIMVGDRLLGAVSYFLGSASPLAGVTPAGAIYEVATRGVPAPTAHAAIPVPEDVRRLAAADGLTPAQARAMTPLPLPVAVSGPTGSAFDEFARALERAYPHMRAVRSAGAASAGGTPVPIQPGSNFGGSLVVGDVMAIGIGTATAVCDPWVFAFGHPLVYEGDVSFGMHGGSAVAVVGDPTWSSYKLVNAGPVAGRIEHDRLAGVAGRLGARPAGTAITSTITNADEGRRVTGRSDAYLHDQVDWIAQSHVAVNYDVKAFDDPTVSGSAEARWVVRGTRDDGRRWTLTRANRYASDGGLSWVASQEMADAVGLLLRNPYEAVRVTSIDYRATASRPYRTYRIDTSGLELALGAGPFRPVTGLPTEVQPGAQLRLRVPLIAYRGPGRTVEVGMTVPADAYGFGDLAVIGGADLVGQECLEGDCAVPGTDLDDLLETMSARPRGDDLVLRLRLTSGEEPPATSPERPDAETRHRLDQVVTGMGFVPVFAGGDAAACGGQGVAPFVDVAPQSTHGPSIACATALGLVAGVAGEPARYEPGGLVRRDAVASVLLRTLEHLGADVPPAPASPRFGDLDGNVHADAIERLAAAGILEGRAGDAYEPRAAVRRDQLATLLVATLDHLTGQPSRAAGPPPYADVSGVHAGAIATATERGLLMGASDGRFRPAAGTRRDQLASVMMRLVQAFEAD